MSSKLIITQGCPGSGKSTWAREQCKKSPSTVMVERDQLREMLFGNTNRKEYKFSKERENLVTIVQDAMIKTLLNENKNVIVSDTNLNPSVLERIKAHSKNHSIVVFDVEWEDLVERNKYRGNEAVPIDVLRNMYLRMHPTKYVGNPENPKAVIFDLDGTLAIHKNRGPYEFHKCDTDEVDLEVLNLLNKYKEDHKIIICSGRDEGNYLENKIKSEQWLKDNNIHYDFIVLRKHGDRRRDSIIKKEILLKKLNKYNVVLAVDDRQQVVDMWRRLGIKTFQVNYGDF